MKVAVSVCLPLAIPCANVFSPERLMVCCQMQHNRADYSTGRNRMMACLAHRKINVQKVW